LLIGSSVTTSPSFGAYSSINAEHDCRTDPFTSIVHEPHTSSRHPASYETGVVFSPLTVTGFAAIHWRQEITFALPLPSEEDWTGTSNSSHVEGLPRPSHRLMRKRTVRVPGVAFFGVPLVVLMMCSRCVRRRSARGLGDLAF